MSTTEHIVKILSIRQVTHDVKSFRLEKPRGYTFVPGQATEVSINTPALKEEKRPFTFTSLPDNPFLEFTIKRYPDHQGVTDALHTLKKGDELIIRDVWGAIAYKGAGYFIAGGAGITPFLAILRQLYQQRNLDGNTLFFSNKTQADIIDETELKNMLGENAVFVLTKEAKPGYIKSYINEAFLKEHVKDFSKKFYICGPDAMISDIAGVVEKLGADAEAIVFEK